jgi:hypothetical protein
MQRGREWFFSLQQDKTDKAPVIDVMKAGYMKAVGVVSIHDDCTLLVGWWCRL